MKGRVLKEAPTEGRGKATTYPWDEWCDGQWWEVIPAEFGKTLSAVRQSIYQHAWRMGCKVQVAETHNKTRLAFQFYDE